MSEMVERVARALIERTAFQHGGWTDRSQDEFEADARAAIAAMREPTKRMRLAGDDCHLHWMNTLSLRTRPQTLIWKAMIDEALK